MMCALAIYIKRRLTIQLQPLVSEQSKDCIVRHRRPSSSYNMTVLYILINESFDQYTHDFDNQKIIMTFQLSLVVLHAYVISFTINKIHVSP